MVINQNYVAMNMNFYKPYSYLYKREADPGKLKSCFVGWIPKGKKLSFSRITNTTGKTTIAYIIETDLAQTSDHFEDYSHEIDWGGISHDVEVIIGSGSGGNGGSNLISSDNAEFF